MGRGLTNGNGRDVLDTGKCGRGYGERNERRVEVIESFRS